MLTGMAPLVILVTWNSASIKDIAGAMMEDAKGVMNPIAESRPVINHFRVGVKFRGF
jgi:hypothetical protein